MIHMKSSRFGIPKVKSDPKINLHYTPTLISKRPKLFSPSMLQLISKSEREFTRADERARAGPYSDTLHNMLLNLESMASTLLDGAPVDMLGVLLSSIRLRGKKLDQPKVSRNSTNRAIQYREYLGEHNSRKDASDFTFTPESVAEIYEELNYSKNEASAREYRTSDGDDLRGSRSSFPLAGVLPSEHIDEYMNDFCDFCNTNYYTPQIQAGLAHFQINWIKPFRSKTDALGRQMACKIFAKRRFAPNLMVTVALDSLINMVKTDDEENRDLNSSQQAPTRQNPLEMWICRGVNMLIREVELVSNLEKAFRSIESKWRTMMPKTRHDDTCDIMLRDLMDYPIVNTRYVSMRCGKTMPAANDAIKKLVDKGILRPLDKRKRNRYFYSPDMFYLYRRVIESVVPAHMLSEVDMRAF